MKKGCIADVDDLFCEEQITRWLVPIHERRPDFIVHAYAIPNRLGPVHELAAKYPWVVFAQHGLEHVHGECRAWTKEFALEALEIGKRLGYAPIFKPPNWICDADLEGACAAANVVLHVHEEYEPSVSGLRYFRKGVGKLLYLHTHITENPATDFIAYRPDFLRPDLASSFHHIEDVALTV